MISNRMNRTVVLLQMAKMCRLLMRLPCSRKKRPLRSCSGRIPSFRSMSLDTALKWSVPNRSEMKRPEEMLLPSRTRIKCNCSNSSSNHKKKKCHGRLVVGNTDDPRVVHRFMMCNCRAVRNNLWSFSPSFLLFPFFVSSSGLCPIFSFRSKFCLVNLKAKKSWRNVCFFVCLSETLFDMDRKENVGVVVLEPKYGKGRKRMRGWGVKR